LVASFSAAAMVSRMGPIVRGIEEEVSKVIEWGGTGKGFCSDNSLFSHENISLTNLTGMTP
jgi:hypothetical protein